MRFAFVPLVVLAASLTFAATPTATIDPSAAYYKIDMTRPPQPAPVYVVNFPDVQAVVGKVTVDNFPVLQTVGGTVNVGNLPLGDDGSLRVTNVPTPAAQPVLVQLLTDVLRIEGGSTFVSPVVSTSGYSRVGFLFQGSAIDVKPEWRWGAEDTFATVLDPSNGSLMNWCSSTPASVPATRLICAVSGVDLRLVITNPYGDGVPIFYSVLNVYLFP